MDIALHSPPLPPHPTEEKISLAASNTVYTYHCHCTHLLLATTTPLPSLPTRIHAHAANTEKAHIMPLPPPPSTLPRRRGSRGIEDEERELEERSHYGLLIGTTLDSTPQVVRSDMGFEKRYNQHCGRCGLVVGYQLDWSQFASVMDGERTRHGRREDVVYLLSGGFVTTSEMFMGKAKADSKTNKGGLDLGGNGMGCVRA